MARYQFVTEEKADGATFTPVALAQFVAEQIVPLVVARVSDGRALRIVDPAVGEGILLECLLQELAKNQIKNVTVHGFDTNPESIKKSQSLLQNCFPSLLIDLRVGDFLEHAAAHVTPSLFLGDDRQECFDVIVANPPYVRTQIMGAVHAQRIASRFGLTGRVDLAHAFLLGMNAMLSPDGVAGIIVSNRFMSTRSGSRVRQVLREAGSVRHIWDLGDTKLFEAAVLPSVLLLEKKTILNSEEAARFTSIYQTDDSPEHVAENPIEALRHEGVVELTDTRRFRVRHGKLDVSLDASEVWRIKTDSSDAWMAAVDECTWGRFGDVGKVRVGVKTCADKVFIRSDWETFAENETPELLFPLTTHHVGRSFRAVESSKKRLIVYPHVNVEGERRVADLSLYPNTTAYLEKHRVALEARSYVLEAGRKWYELWVPQDPQQWSRPKLVFRDISERPTFWIDLEGTIVNGDCYWLTLDAERDIDLLWLAVAVANSSFIEEFYDHRFNNKLYAGRRRFITQYVEQFPLPDPSALESRELVRLAKDLHQNPERISDRKVIEKLNDLVYSAFGVSVVEEVCG